MRHRIAPFKAPFVLFKHEMDARDWRAMDSRCGIAIFRRTSGGSETNVVGWVLLSSLADGCILSEAVLAAM